MSNFLAHIRMSEVKIYRIKCLFELEIRVLAEIRVWLLGSLSLMNAFHCIGIFDITTIYRTACDTGCYGVLELPDIFLLYSTSYTAFVQGRQINPTNVVTTKGPR